MHTYVFNRIHSVCVCVHVEKYGPRVFDTILNFGPLGNSKQFPQEQQRYQLDETDRSAPSGAPNSRIPSTRSFSFFHFLDGEGGRNQPASSRGNGLSDTGGTGSLKKPSEQGITY